MHGGPYYTSHTGSGHLGINHRGVIRFAMKTDFAQVLLSSHKLPAKGICYLLISLVKMFNKITKAHRRKGKKEVMLWSFYLCWNQNHGSRKGEGSVLESGAALLLWGRKDIPSRPHLWQTEGREAAWAFRKCPLKSWVWSCTSYIKVPIVFLA